VVENLAAGADPDQLVGVLVAQGVSPEVAGANVDRLQQHPYFNLADTSVERVGALERLLRIRRALELLSDSNRLDHQTTVTGEDFLRRYYSLNRPLVLTGLAASWKPTLQWTPAYLSSVIGDHPVEVMSARETDPEYEINCEAHRNVVSFSKYAELITTAGPSNDVYLVANNHFFRNAVAERLWDDLDIECEYLDATLRSSETLFLWFGPAGTVTPLHYDLLNVLYVQVYGRKQFTLVSPLDGPCLYNQIGVYSPVDPTEPDYDKYPQFRSVKPLSCVLQPGDALFIPVTWWHHVQSIDVSISLSFTNFAYPNNFTTDLFR